MPEDIGGAGTDWDGIDVGGGGGFAPADIGADYGGPEGWGVDYGGGGGGGTGGLSSEGVGDIIEAATAARLQGAGRPFSLPIAQAELEEESWLGGLGNFFGFGPYRAENDPQFGFKERRGVGDPYAETAVAQLGLQTPPQDFGGRDDEPLPPQLRRPPPLPALEEAATYRDPYGPQVFNPQPYEGYDFTTAGFRGLPSDLFYRPQVAQGGGLMGLRNQAKQVARQGRGGDTMLMHMRPDEVAGLASLGGVTRNPDTGLPENFLGPLLGGMLGASLGPAGWLGGALATGAGAGLGQAAQSYMLGEEDPLKKGLLAGLGTAVTAGLFRGGAEFLGGAPTGYEPIKAGSLQAGQVVGEGGLGASQQFLPIEEMVAQGTDPLTGSYNLADYQRTFGAPQFAGGSGLSGIQSGAQKMTASMLDNPFTAAGAFSGLGGMAAEQAMLPKYTGPLPTSGTGGTYRDPRLVPDTRRPTQLAQTADLTQYGYGPEGRFFYPNIMDPHRLGYTQYAQAGGLQSLPIDDEVEETETVEEVEGSITDLPVEAPTELAEGGIGSLPIAGGAEALIEDVTQQAIAAIKGDHPEPEIAITRFAEVFGPGAFEGLRRIIIQEERARGLGRAHEGLVRGADGGRDDLRRGNIDGREAINVSSGEHIWSADDVALAGDGNTEAGARRLDAARNKLRMMAHGTIKRPNYIGEEGVEEVFEEVGVA